METVLFTETDAVTALWRLFCLHILIPSLLYRDGSVVTYLSLLYWDGSVYRDWFCQCSTKMALFTETDPVTALWKRFGVQRLILSLLNKDCYGASSSPSPVAPLVTNHSTRRLPLLGHLSHWPVWFSCAPFHVYWHVNWRRILIPYYRNKKKRKSKFRCSAAMVNAPGEVAMETELHWPQMKASEGLDFDCTSIFNHRLF